MDPHPQHSGLADHARPAIERRRRLVHPLVLPAWSFKGGRGRSPTLEGGGAQVTHLEEGGAGHLPSWLGRGGGSG